MSKTIKGMGLNFSPWDREAFHLSAHLYRLLVLLSYCSFLAIWTTGYLRPQIYLMSLPMLLMLWRGRGLLAIPFVIQGLSLMVMAYSLSVYRTNIPGVIVLVEFTALILFLQLQILNTARSAGGVLILALMIVLAVAAMNVNFLFPLSLIPFLFFLCLVLIKIAQLRHEKLSGDESGLNLGLSLFLKPTKVFFAVAGFFLVWIALFYLVPRSDAYGLASETSRRRLQGFTDTLQLGETGLLEDNPAVVMRVRPSDGENMSASIIRRLKSKRLRGLSFNGYANGHWSRGNMRRYYIDLSRTDGEFEILKNLRGVKNLYQLEIMLENNDPPVIFIPDQTVLTDFDVRNIRVDTDQAMFFLGRSTGNRRYLARVILDPVEVADVRMDEINLTGYMRHFLSRGGIDQRIQQIAQQIASGTTTINQRVNATMRFLRNGFSYSLNEESPVEVDPAVNFLFLTKSGSCEHFATAMTLLLRAMGVPTRPVNGYTMGDWNELGKFFTVRQRHAHTWVEVYFPGSGWVPFDPTPPEEEYVPETELEKFMVQLWEIYEGYWFNLVYNFDQRTQMLGFRRIQREVSAAAENLFGFAAAYYHGLIALLILFWFFQKRLSRPKKSQTWIPGWYFDWESRQNTPRQSWETPKEYHQRLLNCDCIDFSQAEDLQKLAELADLSALDKIDREMVEKQARSLCDKIAGRK